MKNILKTNIFYSIFIIGIIFFDMTCAQAQEFVEIEYSDYFSSESSSSPRKIPMLSKEERTHRNASTIKIINEDELDDNILKVVDYALSVWESTIINCADLYIEVVVADIEEDIRTSVIYTNDKGTLIPSALYFYLNPFFERYPDTPNGKIMISSATRWDYNIGENISSNNPNLAYGVMRAMARILGFGSSVVTDGQGNYNFSDKRYHTVFDRLVYNSSGQRLDAISVNKGKPSTELKSFIESPTETFSITSNGNEYKLASPPYDKKRPPFVFLEDSNSLMNGDVAVGDYILHIDNTTRSIINSLGWNTQSPTLVTIESEDISETGLASAYSSYRFFIKESNLSIVDPSWILKMTLKDGTVENINLQDNGLSCTTPNIENEGRYKINADGDIEAQLHFSCIINGKEEKAIPFKIYYELKPFIEYATIENIVDNSPYSTYNAHYKVKYRGAERIKVTIEEEYGGAVRSWYSREPCITYGVVNGITSPFCAWIDFEATNKYGKSLYTIELGPYGEVLQSQSYTAESYKVQRRRAASIDEDIANQVDDKFEVYNLNGILLGRFDSIDDIKQMNKCGFLVVRHLKNNEIVETIKMTVK